MLFTGFFKKSKASSSSSSLFSKLKQLITLNYSEGRTAAELLMKEKQVNDYELTLLLQNQKDYFIPLEEFFKLLDCNDLNFKAISKACVHRSEISCEGVSVIDVYAVPQEPGILLLPDKPENYEGEKVCLITIKRGK